MIKINLLGVLKNMDNKIKYGIVAAVVIIIAIVAVSSMLEHQMMMILGILL